MCQNGTENCSFTPCSFHYLSQNNSKYPIQAIFLAYDFTAAPLLFKIGTFCVPAEVESGFSVKIGTVPPKSGRLDTLEI